jgi:hypothetical protein
MSFRRAISFRQLQVYHIINCRHSTPPKNKYVVIACEDGDWHGFFINSQINQFVHRRPRLLPCVAQIFADDHHFLRHDSYVNCKDIYEFVPSELTDLKGVLSPIAIQDVQNAVRLCPVLRPHYKSLILGI